MRFLNENRPRLLVISQEDSFQNELVTLMTGYGFYVDYLSTLKDGLRKFKSFRHVIIMLQADELEQNIEKAFRLFNKVQKNVKIVILTNNLEMSPRFLNAGAFDVISKDQSVAESSAQLSRLVMTYRSMVRYNWMKFTLVLMALAVPVLIMLAIALMAGDGG